MEPECKCKVCLRLRERLHRKQSHSGSDCFCGPCSSGGRGQGCDLDPYELRRDIELLQELLDR